MTKKIHFIWISRNNERIPRMCLEFLAQWAELHPDWTFRIWGNEDIADLEDLALNAAWVNIRIPEAQVVNRMRMRVIYNEGGLYADVDTKPIKNVEAVLAKADKDFIVGQTQARTSTGGYIVDLNIFYAPAGNSVLKDCLDKFPVQAKGNKHINTFVSDECTDRVTYLNYKIFQAIELFPESVTLHWPYRLASWIK